MLAAEHLRRIDREAVPPTDQLLTIDQLSTFLQVSVQTIYRWRTTGTGPPGMKVGRHVRYRRADVDKWLTTLAARP
jgi:excisionase family DNA binding protein